MEGVEDERIYPFIDPDRLDNLPPSCWYLTGHPIYSLNSTLRLFVHFITTLLK